MSTHHLLTHAHALRPLPPTPPPTPPRHNALSALAIRALYAPTTPLSLMHLSALEITLLTCALSARTVFPSPYQHEPLPASLLNPTPLPQALTTTVMRAMGASAALPSAPSLCHGHRHLNAQLVGSVLDAVLSEVEDWLPEILIRIGAREEEGGGAYMPSLERFHRVGLSGRGVELKSTRAAYRNLSPLAIHHIRAAEDILSLILPAAEVEYLYARAPTTFSPAPSSASSPPPTSHAHSHHSQPSKHKQTTCPACLLTHLSSSPTALIGLRSILLARLPGTVLASRQRSPALELIQGFLACFGAGEAAFMLGVSGRVGRELAELLLHQDGNGAEGRGREKRQMDHRRMELEEVDSRMPGKPERLGRPGRNGEVVGWERSERPPEVRYASKPRCAPPTKPLPAPPLWSPLLPARASCVPEPLRIGLRG